jgi:hypothetical protein
MNPVRAEQMTLNLWDQVPGFDALVREEGICGLSVALSWRLKKGWRVEHDRRTGRSVLTAPAYFSEAPIEIKRSLIRWALIPIVNKRGARGRDRGEKRRLERLIWEYVASRFPRLAAPRRVAVDPAAFGGSTKGVRYDLKEIFAALNRGYFQDDLHAFIRWGAPHTTTSHQTARTDPSGNRFNLITIAGVYNRPEVPLYAVEGVVYHEMAHIACPPYKKNGKNVIHGPEFKKTERRYARFREWRRWEKAFIKRLRQAKKTHVK